MGLDDTVRHSTGKAAGERCCTGVDALSEADFGTGVKEGEEEGHAG